MIKCEYWSYNIQSTIDVSMFLIGILVTYYMYTAINMIHQFAKKGRLPRELARKRLKCCMATLIGISVVILSSFWICNTIFHSKVEYESLAHSITVFALVRALGLVINAGMMIATIYKLKSAKVSKSETGHLNILDASILLIFMILMAATGLASNFTSRFDHP